MVDANSVHYCLGDERDEIKIQRILLNILLLLAFICGCATFIGYPSRSENVKGELKQLENYLKPEIMEEYNKIQDSIKKMHFRNEIVNARIRAIDIHFNDFQQRL